MCIAAAIAGAAVVGAGASVYSADKQSSAAHKAADLQQSQYQQTRSDQAPYRTAGQTALSTLSDGTAPGGQFTHTFDASDLNANLAPNYAFQLQQGQAAQQNQAGVSGGLVGGNAMKGLEDYTQGTAAGAYQQAYNNYNTNQSNIFNRLASIAGLGQTATQATDTAGQNAAQASGSLGVYGAASQAAGITGAANSLTNGVGNYLGWNYLNGSGGGGTGGAGLTSSGADTAGAGIKFAQGGPVVNGGTDPNGTPIAPFMRQNFIQPGAGVWTGNPGMGGGAVNGPGTTTSDSIPANLSNGEHVMDANTVSAIGGGDNAAGQSMLNNFRAQYQQAQPETPAPGSPIGNLGNGQIPQFTNAPGTSPTVSNPSQAGNGYLPTIPGRSRMGIGPMGRMNSYAY